MNRLGVGLFSLILRGSMRFRTGRVTSTGRSYFGREYAERYGPGARRDQRGARGGLSYSRRRRANLSRFDAEEIEAARRFRRQFTARFRQELKRSIRRATVRRTGALLRPSVRARGSLTTWVVTTSFPHTAYVVFKFGKLFDSSQYAWVVDSKGDHRFIKPTVRKMYGYYGYRASVFIARNLRRREASTTSQE